MITTTGEVTRGLFKVFAFPTRANMHPYNYIGHVLNDVPAEYYIIRYASFAELVDDVVSITTTDTWIDQKGRTRHNPACSTIEIYGHGNPTECDGLDISNVDYVGGLFAKIRWADNVEIYLSACNTGCRYVQDEQGIAERLADLVPSKRRAFRCTVFGTVGFHWGSYAGGTSIARDNYVDEGGARHLGNYHWARSGTTTCNDPDPHMRSYRGFRGVNSA